MSKNVTVQYRYLNLDNLGPNFHLKNVVVDVLRRSARGENISLAERVKFRKIDLDQDGSYVILNKMNSQSEWNGPLFCGQLLHVRAGADVAGIVQSLDAEVSELDLRHLTMGDNQRVVDGVLYFAIVHNHVGLIEGQRARSRTLERYLTRLLQDAGELDPGMATILNAKLEGMGTVKEVSELLVKPRNSSRIETTDATISKGAGTADSHGKTVFDVLKALGWSDDEIEGVQSGIPQDGWIEGTFKMIFKKSAKKRATVEKSLLEEALRNHHPSAFGLRDPFGSSEKQGISKLSAKKNVAMVGDLLEPDGAMNAIVDMLKSWANSGKIDCDFET